MTSIKLIVTGAAARAEVDGVLTSGMVGIPVTIEYDGAWDGLTKNLVCRNGSYWYGASGDVRTILNIENEATVAHEVMVAGRSLFLGVEGHNSDGTQVFPTVWANCGIICPGANADADPSADPTLPIYEQLEQRINDLEKSGGSGGAGEDGGYYTPAVSQPEENKLQFDFTPSKADMPAVEPVKIDLPDSSPNAGGLTEAGKRIILTLFQNAVFTSDQSGKIAALSNLFLNETVAATGIALSESTLSFTASGAKTLVATITPNGATDPVVWSSDNTNVATVSQTGVVTPLADGECTITAIAGSVFASCKVTVSFSADAPDITQDGDKLIVVSALNVTQDGTTLIIE